MKTGEMVNNRKKYGKTRYKAFVTLLHIAAAMLAMGLCLKYLSHFVLMSPDGSQCVVLDPLEQARDVKSLTAFKESFVTDAASLIRYLAVCRQFETADETELSDVPDKAAHFDADKEVDLISYYFRKMPNVNADSDGAFVYRVQDLIAWNDLYGFQVREDGSLEEVFFTTDHISIYDKDSDIYLFMNRYRELILPELNASEAEDFGSQTQSGFMPAEDLYGTIENSESYAQNDASILISEEGFVQEEDQQEFTITTIQEQNEMTDFDGETLTLEEAFRMYTQILKSVAADLSYNYESYQNGKDYFAGAGSNFKYLYLTEKRGAPKSYFTNLNVQSREEAVWKEKQFADSMAAYVVIDAESGNIENKLADVSASLFMSNFNRYKYAFQGYGGKIYIGVLDEEKVQPEFAEYQPDDLYAQMKGVCDEFDRNSQMLMLLLFVLLVISLILLVVVTMQCGRGYEEKEVHLLAFDRLYTEAALALVWLLLFGAAVFLNDYLPDLIGGVWSRQTAYRLLHNRFWLMLAVLLTAVGDAVFLFFYGSLVRRIKARILLKNSFAGLLLGLCRKLFVLVKKGIVQGYRNSPVVVKTIGSFLPVLLIMHLHLAAGIFRSTGLLVCCWFADAVFWLLLVYINLVRNRIIRGIDKISEGELEYQVSTNHIYGENLRLAKAVNHIGEGIRDAVNQSMKNERLKTDLITNVSHDIKTPLTSIINYVDLLKRERVEDETIRGYIEVLDNKSQRLKQLTEDLVEASKISSGNIVLVWDDLDIVQLLQQALGEFSDRFEEKQLKVVAAYPENACMIRADSRRMWRVIDNLLVNIDKYALEKTRVYVEVKDLSGVGKKVSVSLKNISRQALNIDAEELTERFIRGDISRSTEGSGLGLSIAKSLVEAQGGTLSLYLDGDLFKVTILF